MARKPGADSFDSLPDLKSSIFQLTALQDKGPAAAAVRRRERGPPRDLTQLFHQYSSSSKAAKPRGGGGLGLQASAGRPQHGFIFHRAAAAVRRRERRSPAHCPEVVEKPLPALEKESGGGPRGALHAALGLS